MRSLYRHVADGLLCVTLVLSPLLFCICGYAVLGQQIVSIRSDSVRLRAQVNVLPAHSYSVHEMYAPNGVQVREFVSASGQIFAVAWKGPYVPDLRQLIGEYFDQYMDAMANMRRTHGGVVHVETGDLVFESGGHMRFIVGRAYLRSKLPDGVGPDEIH